MLCERAEVVNRLISRTATVPRRGPCQLTLPAFILNSLVLETDGRVTVRLLAEWLWAVAWLLVSF